MPNCKVAYILLWYPEPTETFIFREVEGLGHLGLSVNVFSLYGPKARGLSAGMKRPGTPVTRIGTRRALEVLRGALAPSATGSDHGLHPGRTVLLRRWRGVVRTAENLWAYHCGRWLAPRLQALGIEHIHAPWAAGPATAAWTASLVTGIPFSFAARARDIHPQDGALADKARQAAFVRLNTAVNLDYLAAMAPDAAGKLQLVYNCATIPRVDPAPVSMEPPVRLLAVGRLVGKKGYEHLIEACRILSQRGTAFRLTLVGDGPRRRGLEGMVHRYGLADSVRFAGFVPHEGVSRFYREADLFIQPSIIDPSGDRDGIPNVLMEAQLHRLPVIATDVSGIGELVIDGETGILIRPGDPGAIADSVSRSLADRERALELAAAGCSKVAQMFDCDTNLGRLARLFCAHRLAVPVIGAGV